MFKEGDVIVNEHGNKATILAVCGKVFSRSLSGDQNQNQHYGWMSFDTAEENGWKLYELKDTVTLTTADGDKVEISKKSSAYLECWNCWWGL